MTTTRHDTMGTEGWRVSEITPHRTGESEQICQSDTAVGRTGLIFFLSNLV